MRISYSRCSTYQRCPQQYRLQYVDRIPPPRAIELEFGAAVHQALKFMHDPAQIKAPSLEDVVDAFARAWKEEAPPGSEEERQTYFEQGVLLLQRYYGKHSHAEKDRYTATTEQFFTIPFDREHALTGRIDRVDVLPDNRLEVIDYKTSRRMPPQSVLAKDAQLAIYRMAADVLYPGREVTTALLYVFHDYEMRMTQSEEFLAEKQEEIREVIAGIQAESFDPRPGPQCDWCGYQEYCQLYRAPLVPPDLADLDIGGILAACAELDAQGKETEQRLEALKQQIHDYLDRCQAERVVAGGYVAERRKWRRAAAWDEARLREVLEPLGLWDKATRVSSSAVRDLLQSQQLSQAQKREVEAAASYRETQQLRVRPAAAPDEESEQ